MGQMKKFSDLYEKKVDVTQRKKQARRMAKMAKSKAFQFKKRKALLKRHLFIAWIKFISKFLNSFLSCEKSKFSGITHL